MKLIISNKDNIKEAEVTEVVKRVKALIINSKKEILLVYSHNDYEFLGGHVEDGELYMDTLIRELREEAGIELANIKISPFAFKQGYYRDHPSKGKNRKTEIYYYEILTDNAPDLKKQKFTRHEKDGKFTLKYVPLSKVKKVLRDNAKKYGDQFGIQKEMIEIIDVYNSL